MAVAAASFALPAALPAHGEIWQARPVKVPGGSVSQIHRSADGKRTFVRAGGRWLELTACADHRFCFTPRRPDMPKSAPKNGLPDGHIASRAAASGPVSAWYESPTKSYGHGILGDAVEAAALSVRTADGKRLSVNAGAGNVFEDLTPRLADLDGDGNNEVIAIRTDVRRGAMIAVYGVNRGSLALLAATKPIGRPNRWRNPALILPDPASGGMLIAEVVTPHIGGALRLWALEGSAQSGYRLAQRGSAAGFSNHVIGSRQLDLMAGGGNGLIAVPSADRAALRIMQAGAASLSERGAAELPGRIEHAIGMVREASGPVFLAGLGDGRLFAVARPNADLYCISNGADEQLLLVAESGSGDRIRTLASPGQNWCVSRNRLKTVWAFPDRDAVEGCSHPVGKSEAGLTLEEYTSFDNCRWTPR